MPEQKVRPVGRMKFELAIKADEISDDGVFSGYGSVFGVVDSYNEIVDKGAFAESLATSKKTGSMPKMLWQHNAAEPIGVWHEIYEDTHGLFVKGQLLISDDPKEEIAAARQAYVLMKKGIVDGLSIGYRVIEHAYNNEEEVTHLTKLKLREVSLVTFPANQEALVATVKSIRDLEGVLRDAGFSRKEATAVALHGWSALDQRDAEPEDADESALVASVKSWVANMTGKE